MLTRREMVQGMAGAIGACALAACGKAADEAGSATSSVSTASATSADSTTVTEPPASTDPAPTPTVTDTPAPASELARMLDAGEVSSIRLIGDSITAGWGCDGYGPETDTVIYEGDYGTFWETAPEVACWANDFRSYADGRGVGSFVNAGIPGAKMRWLAEEPDAWIGDGADVMFVMLGTNDAVYFTPEEFREDAEVGLEAVNEACQLMVVLSPPTNDRSDAENLYGPEVLDEVLTSICDERGYLHVSLLDAIELYTDDFNEDQCHPTSSGSHKLWERIRSDLGL